MTLRAGISAVLQQLMARLHSRKRNFQLAFGTPAGKAVLRDLARFCRAHETTIHPTQDARTHAMLEGRRQVWLRISEHLTFTPEELAGIYRAAILDPTGAQDG